MAARPTIKETMHEKTAYPTDLNRVCVVDFTILRGLRDCELSVESKLLGQEKGRLRNRLIYALCL